MLVLRSSALGRSSSSALGACAIAKPATPNVVITTVIAATVTTRMIRFTADVPPSSRCAFSPVQRPCGIILESQRYWKVKRDPLAPRQALPQPGVHTHCADSSSFREAAFSETVFKYDVCRTMCGSASEARPSTQLRSLSVKTGCRLQPHLPAHGPRELQARQHARAARGRVAGRLRRRKH